MKKIMLTFLTFITLLSLTAFTGCNTNEEYDEPTYVTGDVIADVTGSDEDTGSEEDADELDNSKNLVISLSALTTDAQFFGIIVDETYMEVIAFKYGTSYRTAFNTCQVCYGSRKAYYIQSGSNLVCQNCGNRFALSNVGLKSSSYTCSPYPILDTDRTTDDENIIITYNFLVKSKNMFKNWKVT
ncbi:MAG: Fe-S-containing protein [Candidatus Coproplasma sp.]